MCAKVQKKMHKRKFLNGKSDCDKDWNKNTGSVSPIKINKNQGGTLFCSKECNAALESKTKV